jgi:putative ABC transport system substrate-binding protein
VAVLWNPDPRGSAPLHWRNTQAAGQVVGVTLQSVEMREPRELPSAFGIMTRERAQAVVVLPDPILFAHLAEVVGLAAQHRLPVVYEYREFADAGGLLSYGTSLADLWRRATTYVDRILKGAKPADLPVEQPTKFDLVINLKTAKALGLTIPPAVLARADEVIQ